jgi:hypothetical protein
MPERNYGKTPHGVPITDDLVAKLAKEAEEGFDVDEMLRRRRGRPPMGTSAAGVESVRLDPQLRAAVQDRATRESATVSSVIREALRLFLASDLERRGSEWPLPSPLEAGPTNATWPSMPASRARPHLQLVVGPRTGIPDDAGAPASPQEPAQGSHVVLRPTPGLTKLYEGEGHVRTTLHVWDGMRLSG